MKASKGMTLIELSVVILLLLMMASLTLPLFTGIAQSTRNQITEARVTQIKQAIINVQTVNGTPTVSGFVADVGRLPYCIRELIDGYCDATPPYTSPCIPSSSGSTACIGASTQSPTNWKGPYLQTSDGAFYDGWGNTNTTYSADNFGWYYALSTKSYPPVPAATPTTCIGGSVISGVAQSTCGDTVSLLSSGADGIFNSSGGSLIGYDADYPINPVLILPSDWIIDLSTTGLNVQFLHPPSAISLANLTTTCTPAVAGYPTTNITGTTVTSICPPLTMSVTSTIDCPTGYNTFGAPLPTLSGQNVNIFCQSATTGSLYAATVTCSTNSTPPLLAAVIAALPASGLPTVQTVAVTCTSNPTPSITTVSTTTPLSQACAPGVPVTPWVFNTLPAQTDLYGNPISASLSPSPLAAATPPSLCNQTNTIYFADSNATSPPTTLTPMPIGNWIVCARADSGTDCTSTPPLYNSTTITVLPRTPPSVAW